MQYIKENTYLNLRLYKNHAFFRLTLVIKSEKIASTYVINLLSKFRAFQYIVWTLYRSIFQSCLIIMHNI